MRQSLTTRHHWTIRAKNMTSSRTGPFAALLLRQLNQQPPGGEAAGIRHRQIVWRLKQRIGVSDEPDDEEEQTKGRQRKDRDENPRQPL